MNKLKSSIAAVLLALLPALPALAAAMPAPYTARYEVLRNGERLGQATVSFRALADGRAEFSSSTVGSEGLAGLTSATIDERSLLRWRDGAPETVRWNYRQKVAWKTRERGLEVDAGARRMEHHDKDKRWSLAYQPGVLDRSAITIALMQDLAGGRSGELRYLVPDKDELKYWLFRTGASERLDTRLGVQTGVRVERIRDAGDGRATTLWLARDRNYVPLRILQKEANGETIDMRILSLK